jgi:ketosteroid isomerase-like protein
LILGEQVEFDRHCQSRFNSLIKIKEGIMKNPLLVISLVLLLCFGFGCKQAKEGAEKPALDVKAKTEALRTLRETDKSWSQSAPDLEAYMSFIAADVVWFFCDYPPMTNSNEVRSFFEKEFKAPGYSLTWAPDRIDVSDAGDMGYAYGSYKLSYKDSSGLPVEKKSHYATFWRKQSGGGWKVVLEADY